MELEPFLFRYEGAVLGLRDYAPGDDAHALVNRFALKPLEPADYAVFALDLCNNRVDRHWSRFPEEELAKISAMVPGRPLMERHDLRGSLPRGVFFRSSLHKDGDLVSVRPEVYVLRTPRNADFIRHIEGGVYRQTSIGFSFRTPECSVCGKDLRTCDHVPGRSYDGAPCHYVMRDVLDVIEGSVVASGSQGTGFVRERPPMTAAEALSAARETLDRPAGFPARGPWAEE